MTAACSDTVHAMHPQYGYLRQWLINTYRHWCINTTWQTGVDVITWGTCVHKANEWQEIRERKKRKQEHGAFPSVEGGSLVLHVPWFQHAACLSVGVCIYDQSVGQVHLVVAGEGVFIKLFRKPHPHSSEHDGAPATGGSRISLSPQCNVGIMAHTAPSCHPQQTERHHAWTLCSNVRPTLSVDVSSPFLP